MQPVAFGPGQPAAPSHPELVEPRIFNLQPGRNAIQTPRAYEALSFADLRALCDTYDAARIAIESRKDEARGWNWDIRVKPVPGLDRKAQKARADTFIEDIALVKGFLATPDQDNAFETWLMMLLEDLFAIDAPTIYLRPTRGAELYAAEVVDGATIRPLVDFYGRTPRLYTTDVPAPHFHDWQSNPDGQGLTCSVCKWPAAYGQTIQGTTWTYFAAYEMIYEPFHQSVTSPYGTPPIYWVLLTANRALRRQTMDMANFTDGNIPAALYGVPDTWTAGQIAELQELIDTALRGDDKARSRMVFVPSGSLNRINPEPTTAVEEWLRNITFAAFGTASFELGFEPNSGLGGAGFGDASRSNAEKRGSKPLSQYLAGLFNRILAGPMHQPQLEFFWRGLGETEDQLKEAQRDEIFWRMGVKGTDEMREDIGSDPVGLEPTVYDPKIGVVPISALLSTATATAAAENALMDETLAPSGAGPEKAETAAVASAQPGALTTAENADTPMGKAADFAAWRRKALRAVKDGRDPARFNSTEIDPETQALIRERLAKAHTPADVRAAFSTEVLA